MKIEIKKLPHSQVELNIEVGLSEIQPFLLPASRAISEEIKIPGFRPGKAPISLVEKKIGKAQLWEEAVKQGLPSFLEQAFREKKIEALGRPEVSILKIAPENTLIFKAIAAVMPEVILGDYHSVKIKKPKVKKTTAQDVNDLIQKLRESRASYATVERPAALGDRVEIDFQCYLKNNLVEGGTSQNYPLILGQGQFVPGFEAELAGLKSGEKKEFNLKFPPDYSKPNLAGRLARFKVKINLVREVKLPALDDAFAQSLGPNFTSLADLKSKLSANLQKEAEMAVREKYELQVLEKVCAGVNVEISDVMLEAEKERMLAELKQDLEGQGGKFEDYLKSIKKSEEDLKKGWGEPAEKRVKTSLILREIGNREKIGVLDKEIEAEINQIIKAYPNIPGVREKFSQAIYKDHLRGLIRNRKVIKLLCAQ